METLTYLTIEQLEGNLDYIRQSPKDHGTLELIVRRPSVDEREILNEAMLDLQVGLLGDNWNLRRRSKSIQNVTYFVTQITIMNSRVIDLLAQSRDRWPWAGDQLYVDLDLSADNLPPGTRLAIGSAVIEVTAKPHTGCKKFAARYGQDAVKFVNSMEGKNLHLRGVNAKIVQSGMVRVGDRLTKL